MRMLSPLFRRDTALSAMKTLKFVSTRRNAVAASFCARSAVTPSVLIVNSATVPMTGHEKDCGPSGLFPGVMRKNG